PLPPRWTPRRARVWCGTISGDSRSMAFNCADSFSADYPEARAKFREAAAQAGGALEHLSNPNRGPDGGDLTTDIAWFGPRDAEAVLVQISGTHGVEGFCGSGAQVHWLRRGEASRLAPGVAVMLIHAINPYGFAWLRRVSEDNVDLNRNWVDFNAALPTNPGYDELSEILCPADWSAETQARTGAALGRYAVERGELALRDAISLGQYNHPEGIFYGGTQPTWPRLTQTAIYEDYLRQAGRIGVIDYHTGLGPWGYGEQIVIERPGTPGFARAAAWYGSAIASPVAGTSASGDIKGDGLAAATTLLPHAAVTGMALEVGTLPSAAVTAALRADAWLHAHGDPTGPAAGPIKAQMRDAFYGDADDWKGMVAAQSLLVCREALAGLSRG
ncbi:MAG: M14 family metallopeptidase, partial [Caulobacterales bacterium]